MAELQYQLLQSAFECLKPGGVLVYSTCTLNHVENQQVIGRLLEDRKGAVEVEPLANLFEKAPSVMTSEGYLHLFPHHFDAEGFFVARLRKTASSIPVSYTHLTLPTIYSV